MGAKKGRLLLKRHYVALLEDAGGVENTGKCIACYTHTVNTHTALFTHTRTHYHGQLRRQDESLHIKGNVLVSVRRVQQVHEPRPSLQQR